MLRRNCAPALGILLGGFLLTGCNTQPQKATVKQDYSALGDPKSKLEYGTAMPVGSAVEAILLGDAALARGDTDRALFEYIRALEGDANNADVLFKIGRIHLGRGDKVRAETAFGMALSKNPGHAGALTEYGVLRMHRRDYEGAEQLLRKAVTILPNNPKAYDALGVIADMQGDHVQAQKHYSEAIALGGNNPLYLNNLGYSRYLSGDMVSAEQAFSEALRVNPNHERAWRNLGLIFAKQGRYEEALDAFGKTEEVYEAYNDVGYVAMVAGRLDDADRFFQEAMRLSPTYYELAEQNAKRLLIIRSAGKAAQQGP